MWTGVAEVLPKLYEQILIPSAVLEELSHTQTPQSVQERLASSPVWLQVARPQMRGDLGLSHLGSGEQEAITLAVEQYASLVYYSFMNGTAS